MVLHQASFSLACVFECYEDFASYKRKIKAI